MRLGFIAFLILTAFSSFNAFSAEKKHGWYGDIEAGITLNTGNTDTKTVTVTNETYWESSQWKVNLSISQVYTFSSGATTADKFNTRLKGDYKFSEYNYLYGLVKYEDDRFNGYQYELEESFGYGRRLVNGEKLSLDIEVGPGAYQAKLDAGTTQSELTGRGSTNLKWDISEGVAFGKELTLLIGDSATVGTKLTSDTSLKVALTKSLAMKNSYNITYKSVVPSGFKTTDTTTSMTLVFNF